MTKVFITTNQKTKMGGYRDVSDCERFGTPTVLFENPKLRIMKLHTYQVVIVLWRLGKKLTKMA